MTDAAAVPTTAPAADAMIPRAHRVHGRRVEIAADPDAGIDEVVTLELEPVEGPSEPYAPGQFAMVWAPGVGEVPISVSSLDDGTVGLTIRAVGATTAALCGTERGGVVGLRGPFGRGWSEIEPDRPMVVVAGGIGLAPLWLYIQSLVAGRRSRTDEAPVVVVGARTPSEILFADRLAGLSEEVEVHLTVDRAAPGWDGEIGLVTSTLARIGLRPGTAAALCGPEVMMRIAAGDLVAAGADPASVEVSLERSMACAVAHCGRCQLGPVMLCRDGPVLSWPEASALMGIRRW